MANLTYIKLKHQSSKYFIWIIYVILAIVGLITLYFIFQGVYGYIVSFLFSPEKPDQKQILEIGQFLTSTLLAVFLIHTFIAQKKQSFENGFFELLKLHKDIVMEVDVSDVFDKEENSLIYTRQKAFRSMFRHLKPEKTPITLPEMRKRYTDFDASNHKFKTYTGNYSNSVNNILSYLDSWVILTAREKNFYMDILKVNLSDYELLHIVCSPTQDENRKRLIDLYLFEHAKIHLMNEGINYEI